MLFSAQSPLEDVMAITSEKRAVLFAHLHEVRLLTQNEQALNGFLSRSRDRPHMPQFSNRNTSEENMTPMQPIGPAIYSCPETNYNEPLISCPITGPVRGRSFVSLRRIRLCS
jgi:hypothetical protein